MADPEKKSDDKKPSGGPKTTEETLTALIGIVVLFIIAQRVYVSIRGQFIASGGAETAGGIVGTIIGLSFWAKVFAVLVSTVFLAGIFHVRAKLMALAHAEKAFYFPQGTSETQDMVTRVDSKWDNVISHVETDNPNDWKVAILEADIILGDLLDHLGYVGDSIGEKLKQVEKSDFLTLDKAWEAHKVRNAIAHEGGQFLINHREVLRVLELYKDVFDEFYYV